MRSKIVETDHTTGKSGFMIASGANGFMNTDPFSCKGTKFNFEPEYNTARAANIIPWGIGPYEINDQFEIGHFEACTKVSKPATTSVGSVKDTYFKECSGPYEAKQGQREQVRAGRLALLQGGRHSRRVAYRAESGHRMRRCSSMRSATWTSTDHRTGRTGLHRRR